MIPLFDLTKTRRPAVVTRLLITTNMVIGLFMLFMPATWEYAIIADWGLIPDQITRALFSLGGDCRSAEATDFISYAFLHGGVFHLLGNMLFLYIFGDNVEERMGHGQFLAFYLLGAVAAALSQWMVGWFSPVPMIGASGAVAAVMGAYLVIHPGAWIMTWFPPFFLFPVPAFVFMGLWFFMQILNSLLGFLPGSGLGGVAWWAHIGGFLFGFAWAWSFSQVQRSSLRSG